MLKYNLICEILLVYFFSENYNSTLKTFHCESLALFSQYS